MQFILRLRYTCYYYYYYAMSKWTKCKKTSVAFKITGFKSTPLQHAGNTAQYVYQTCIADDNDEHFSATYSSNSGLVRWTIFVLLVLQHFCRVACQKLCQKCVKVMYKNTQLY